MATSVQTALAALTYAYRDGESAPNNPDKAELRAALGLLALALSTLEAAALAGVTVFTTKALMEASSLPVGSLASVTADGANNGIYIKLSSGWERFQSSFDQANVAITGGTINGISQLTFDTGANATDALDGLMRAGASIAAASTLDLETATGFSTVITGNTQIDAITLTTGHVRVMRFTGTPLLKHGATLLLNKGGADIQIEDGDFAIAWGRSADVYVMVIRASGEALVPFDQTNVAITGGTINGISQLTFDTAANATEALDGLMRAGGSIAAASTVNLEDATGFSTVITGNSQIDAITLTTGHVRVLRFTGTPLLKHGSTLLLNNDGDDIQIEDGDIAIAWGRSADVYVSVIPADGRPLNEGSGQTSFIWSGAPTYEPFSGGVISMPACRIAYEKSAIEVNIPEATMAFGITLNEARLVYWNENASPSPAWENYALSANPAPAEGLHFAGGIFVSENQETVYFSLLSNVPDATGAEVKAARTGQGTAGAWTDLRTALEMMTAKVSYDRTPPDITPPTDVEPNGFFNFYGGNVMFRNSRNSIAIPAFTLTLPPENGKRVIVYDLNNASAARYTLNVAPCGDDFLPIAIVSTQTSNTPVHVLELMDGSGTGGGSGGSLDDLYQRDASQQAQIEEILERLAAASIP